MGGDIVKRVLALGLLAGLVVGLLPAAPVSVVGQSGSFSLDLIDISNPSVSVTEVAEDGGSRSLQLLLTVSSVAPVVSVTVTLGTGTATAGASGDFTSPTSFSWTQNVGGSTVLARFVTITPVDDSTVEGDETIVFSASATGYTIPSYTLTIDDDDDDITLSFDDGAGTPSAITGVDEEGGGQSVRVVATAARAPTANLSVSVTIAAGTATATTDYGVSSTTATVTIAASATVGRSSALTVTPVSDTDVEGDETLSVTGTATGRDVKGAELLIFDDDDDITLSFDDGAGSAITGVDEGVGSLAMRVVATAAQPVSGNITVNVSFTAGTASFSDYATAPSATTVSIASGATVGYSQTVVLIGVPDTTVEGDETISVTGTSSGYDVKAAELLIFDDDDDITLSFDDGGTPAAAITGVDEGGGAQTVRVVATATQTVSSARSVVVTIAAGTATATTDYAISASSTTVSIAANAMSGTSAALTVTPVDDSLGEGDETISFTGTLAGYDVKSADLLIVDNEAVTLSFDDGAGSAVTGVGEEGGAQTVRVVAEVLAAVSAETVVSVTIADGTAASPGDYGVSATSTTVTIANGQTSGMSAALQVTPVDDSIVEGDETIAFTGSASGYVVIAADLLITDDDDELTLEVSPTGVLEHADPQSVSVTASFAGTVAADTDVTVAVTGGAGADGATLGASGDFTTDLTGGELTVTISNGQSSGTGSFNLTALADSVDESAAPEKVDLTGTATVGGAEASAMAELSIYDRVITLGVVDAADPSAAVTGLGEDDGARTVRVTAEVPAPAPVNTAVTVTVGAAGTTAVAGSDGDYTTTAPSTAALTINAGDVSASSGDLSFTPLPDRVFEDHEIIKFTGTGPAGYAVTGADLQITDAERELVVTLNPGAVSERVTTIVEAGGPFRAPERSDPVPFPDQPSTGQFGFTGACLGRPGITVRVRGALSATYSENLGLRMNVFDGTARVVGGDSSLGNLDFYARGSDWDRQNMADWDVITINAGSVVASKRYQERFCHWVDNVAEPDETFGIGVHAPDGFTVVNAQGYIVDDDVQISLSRGETVTEGDAAQDMSIGASMHASSSQLTSATVVALSAVEEADPGAGVLSDGEFSYTSLSSSVTVSAGATSSSTSATLAGLSVVDDTVVEGPERLRIVGTPALEPGAAQTVTFEEAVGWITVSDNDGDVSLSVSPGTVVEKAGGQTVTVTASFAGDSSVLTVDTDVVVQIAGGTAALTTDFTTGLSNNRLTVTIPAGRTSGSKTFQLTAVADTTTEASGETVSFSVPGTVSVGGVAVATTGTTLTINDSGQEVALSFTDKSTPANEVTAVGEDDGAQTVAVTATVGTAPSGSDVVVSVTAGALGSTAYAPDDYAISTTSFTITIPDGQTSGSADVVVTPVSDTVTEDHERILFTGEATGYLVAPASLVITDADRTLVMSIDYPGGASSLVEQTGLSGEIWPKVFLRMGDGSSLSTSSTYSSDIRVRVWTQDGSVTESNDFFHGLWGNNMNWHRYFEIDAGDISDHTWFWVRITSNSEANPPETFHPTVQTAPAGFTVERATATIVDRVDTAVRLVPSPNGDVTEGGSGSGVSVTAAFPSGVTSNGLGSDTVVTLGQVAGGTAESDDFSWTPPATAPTWTIPMTGVSSPGSGALALSGLTITADEVVEGPETILLKGAYTLGGESREATGSVRIVDDDANLELSVSPGTVVEGTAETVTVTAAFKGTSTVLTSDTTVTVQVASGDGTGAATLGASDDFTTDATNDRVSVVIPAGALRGSAAFTLTANTDSNTEGVETGKLTGSASIGGQTLTVDQATVSIADPGRGITLAVVDADTGTSGTQTSVAESAGSVTVQVSATLPSAAPAGGTTIGVNVVSGGAMLGADSVWGTGEDFSVAYPSGQTNLPSGHGLAIPIAAAATSGTADFTLTLNDDNVAESAESVVIQGADHTIGTTSYKLTSAEFNITDSSDDTSPTDIDLTLLTDGGQALEEVGEGDGTVTVRVRAALAGGKVLPRLVTVPLRVGGATGDTAAPGPDYKRITNLAVTIPAYSAAGTADFELEITDDEWVEGTEQLSVHGGTLGAALTALGFTTVNADTLQIVDNDLALTLLDSSGNPLTSAAEGTNTQVRARVSYPGEATSRTPRLVRLTTAAGTAQPADFAANLGAAAREIFLPVSQNNARGDAFTLSLRADDIVEGAETVQVTAAVDGFNVAPAVVTITDNESLQMSASPTRPAEPGTSTVTVRFDAASSTLPQGTPVTITTSGTASPSDFTAPSAVTIPARTLQTTFTVTINQDSAQEPNETIIITARAPGYGTATTTLTIPANDQPSGGGGGQQPPPTGGGSPPPTGGGGAPPPAGGGGGGGGGGGAPPPAGGGGGGAPPPVTPPPPPAEPACQGRFCDDDGSVHQANIERIAGWEITLGCDAEDATKYCPSAEITRRQMAAFLYRAVSQRWTIEAPEGIEITDVPEDAWYRTFADWVVSIGAFATTNGLFNPGGVVTRADMAVMMIAAFPHLESVEEPEGLFNDAEDLDPAITRAIEGMYSRGVTRGCTTDPLNYCPTKPVTRAQMASFFVRAIDLVPAAGDDS